VVEPYHRWRAWIRNQHESQIGIINLKCVCLDNGGEFFRAELQDGNPKALTYELPWPSPIIKMEESREHYAFRTFVGPEMIVTVYVDDILIIGKNRAVIDLFKKSLSGMSSDRPGLAPNDKNAQVAQDTTPSTFRPSPTQIWWEVLEYALSLARDLAP
jgi:hypothetical protein